MFDACKSVFVFPWNKKQNRLNPDTKYRGKKKKKKTIPWKKKKHQNQTTTTKKIESIILSQSLIPQTTTLNLVFTPIHSSALYRTFTAGRLYRSRIRPVSALHLITRHHHSVSQLLNLTTAERKRSHPTSLFLLEKDAMIYYERISEQRAIVNTMIRY